MKAKLYTDFGGPELIAKLNPAERFTPTEHALVTEASAQASFVSRDSLVQWYLSLDGVKLAAVEFLAEHARRNGFKRILSLGAGHGVLEALLKDRLGPDSLVVAADFDSCLVEQAKRLLPSIVSIQFDMVRDDPRALREPGSFDLVVFFGSASVMDDQEFIALFRGLWGAGVREIVDFHAGFMTWQGVLKTLLKRLGVRRRRNRQAAKFHAFSRSRGELRRLYRAAGFTPVREFAAGPYRYAAVLKAGSAPEGRVA